MGVAASTLWVMLYLRPVTPLKESDLMSIDTTSTSFLLPKQWSLLNTGAPGVTYGNEVGANQSSGMINVIYGGSEFKFTNFSTAPESFKDSQRAIYFKDIDKWTDGSTSCGDQKVIKKEVDTLSFNGISGLFYFELSCISPSGKPYTIMNRVVLGDDGYVRTATVTAQDYDLKVNRDIYTKMLNSISQSPN